METLPDFLSRHSPKATQREDWPSASLSVEAYLSAELPPTEHVSSARCVVLRGEEVLLQTDVTREHIIPGGRLEMGETPEDAMRREVLEETGWTLGESRLLGFLRFRHLEEVPPDYPHPHPEFLQVIYTAAAKKHLPDSLLHDSHELGTRFFPISRTDELSLAPCEKFYLDVAIET